MQRLARRRGQDPDHREHPNGPRQCHHRDHRRMHAGFPAGPGRTYVANLADPVQFFFFQSGCRQSRLQYIRGHLKCHLSGHRHPIVRTESGAARSEQCADLAGGFSLPVLPYADLAGRTAECDLHLQAATAEPVAGHPDVQPVRTWNSRRLGSEHNQRDSGAATSRARRPSIRSRRS